MNALKTGPRPNVHGLLNARSTIKGFLRSLTISLKMYTECYSLTASNGIFTRMATAHLPANPLGLVAPGFSSPQARGRSAAAQESIERLNALKETMRANVQAARKAPAIAGAAQAAASFEQRTLAAQMPGKTPAFSSSLLAQSEAKQFADSIDVEPGKEKVCGRVKNVRFEKDGIYYLDVLPHGKTLRSDEVFVKGNGIDLKPGSDIVAVGTPKMQASEQYGTQKIVDKSIIFEVVPTTRVGIQRLLDRGYVKGLGADTAKRLCDVFGDELFEVAEYHPKELMNVPGVRHNEVASLVLTVRAKKELPRLMSYLSKMGMNLQTANKVLKKLGPEAIKKIEENPYELMRVPSVGFVKADAVARARGALFDSDQRIAAALEACLEHAAKKGSTYMKVTDLKVQMGRVLEIDDPQASNGGKLSVPFKRIDQVVEHELIYSTKVMVRQHFIDEHAPHLKPKNTDSSFKEVVAAPTERCASLMEYAGMERRIAKRLAAYIQAGDTPASGGAKASGAAFSKLSEEQKRAVRTTLNSPVSVITGRPGCGKTTATKALVDSMMTAGLKVLMVGPTNRAAKQMSDATGHRAKTIHRALGCRGFDVYTHDEDNPIDCDVVIADEQSMVDTRMFDKLLSAIRPGTSLVLIGDIEQLSAISAGNVLSDIIKSGVIPVSYLTEIRRTGKDSSINPNAHRVADRLAPIAPKPGENDDFCMREVRSAWSGAHENAKEKAEHDQIQAVIDQFYDYCDLGHRPEDIQILTPMRQKSKLGANELNLVMKQILNPVGDPALSVSNRNAHEPRTYSVGDRVMYLANDQERDIYNGDLGYICAMDHQSSSMLVDFEGHEVEIAFSELSDLDHAWVNTVHKTQGGEHPAIIFIAVSEHYHMLNRQNIYTAMTRGKKNVCILGDTQRLQAFVEKPGSEMRQTMLDDEIVRVFGALRAANDHVFHPHAPTPSSQRYAP